MRDSPVVPLLPPSCNPDSIARRLISLFRPLSGRKRLPLHAAELAPRRKNGAQYDFYRRDGEVPARSIKNLMVDTKATNVKLVDRVRVGWSPKLNA